MSPMSAEATVVRNYLDWMLSIPWKKRSKIRNDVVAAEKVLERRSLRAGEGQGAHHRVPRGAGASARRCAARSCAWSGPPGVGKTSLGKSIARATGRNFVRMSLGGVRDEAEIRGHRRTYIGSMPGKVIQGMKKAKTSNPLFLLDEIDKLGADWRGDPSSALLEVLDPEQNSHLRRPLPGGGLRPVGRDVRHHRQQPAHAAAADGPHGDHPHPRLHRG